jgi:hypothetical protein
MKDGFTFLAAALRTTTLMSTLIVIVMIVHEKLSKKWAILPVVIWLLFMLCGFMAAVL